MTYQPQVGILYSNFLKKPELYHFVAIIGGFQNSTETQYMFNRGQNLKCMHAELYSATFLHEVSGR
jgi:hypothetical protein